MFGRAFPEAYKEDISPWVAAFDVENAAAVYRGEDLRMSLYRPENPAAESSASRCFTGRRPFRCLMYCRCWKTWACGSSTNGPTNCRMPEKERVWIQDFDMIPAVDRELDLDVIRGLFMEAFEKTLRGETDSDGFQSPGYRLADALAPGQGASGLLQILCCRRVSRFP